MLPDCAHEWSNWHYHHNGGSFGFENNWRECHKCGIVEKDYDMSPSKRLNEETKIEAKQSVHGGQDKGECWVYAFRCSAGGCEFNWDEERAPRFCPICGRRGRGD